MKHKNRINLIVALGLLVSPLLSPAVGKPAAARLEAPQNSILYVKPGGSGDCSSWEARGERPGQPGAWRFSLECVQAKEKRGFDGLEELVAWLQGQLEKKRDVPA